MNEMLDEGEMYASNVHELKNAQHSSMQELLSSVLHAGNAESAESATGELMELLSATETKKRQALRASAEKRGQVAKRLSKVDKELSIYEREVSRDILMMEDQSRKSATIVKSAQGQMNKRLGLMALIERQRKHFVKKLKNGSAQWEAPSYFHIMASSSELDGELGPDTSLMDVAGYFPGHLRLLANAHQMRIRIESMQSQHANDLNVISVEESVRTRLQESVVRREKEKREIEYARNTIEERFGSDIRRVRAEERSQPKPSSRASHSHSSFRRSSSNNRLRRGGGGSPTLGGPSSYSNMKLKYLRRLERNSSSGLKLVRTDLDWAEILAKEEKAVESARMPNDGGELPESPGGSRRSSSIDGKSPLDDQRLIRSSFQMGSDWVGSVEVNNNAQRRSKFSQRKGGPSKVNGVGMAATWKRIEKLDDELEQSRKDQRQAWQELEVILDHRERVIHHQSRKEMKLQSPTAPTGSTVDARTTSSSSTPPSEGPRTHSHTHEASPGVKKKKSFFASIASIFSSKDKE